MVVCSLSLETCSLWILEACCLNRFLQSVGARMKEVGICSCDCTDDHHHHRRHHHRRRRHHHHHHHSCLPHVLPHSSQVTLFDNPFIVSLRDEGGTGGCDAITAEYTHASPQNPSLPISPPLPHSHPPYSHLQLHQHHFGGVPFTFCNWYACTDGFSGSYGVSGCSRGADDDDGNDDDNYDEFHHETDGFVLKEANLWWVKVLSEFNSGR